LTPIIVITDSEPHPIRPGILVGNDERNIIIVFGLARRRGDDSVYSTKVTVKLMEFLSEKGISLLDKDEKLESDYAHFKTHLNARHNVAMVGISYNIRKTWGMDRYRDLLIGIKDCLYDPSVPDASTFIRNLPSTDDNTNGPEIQNKEI